MDAYESIWGSSAERGAQRRAEEKRETKERAHRARLIALAARPRSEWRPGNLEQYFVAKVTELSLPRQPQIDRRALRGSFNLLLANGYKPEDLATAIEDFCSDRPRWSDLVERKGIPIWKLFIKAAPALATRAVVVHGGDDEDPLGGRDW